MRRVLELTAVCDNTSSIQVTQYRTVLLSAMDRFLNVKPKSNLSIQIWQPNLFIGDYNYVSRLKRVQVRRSKHAYTF